MCKTESSRAERPAAVYFVFGFSFRCTRHRRNAAREPIRIFYIFCRRFCSPLLCKRYIWWNTAPNWSRKTLAREQCVQRSPCVLLDFPYRPMGAMCINRILNRPCCVFRKHCNNSKYARNERSATSCALHTWRILLMLLSVCDVYLSRLARLFHASTGRSACAELNNHISNERNNGIRMRSK